MRRRYATVFEYELARAAGTDAQLVLFTTDRETGRTAFYEKGGDAVVAGRWINSGEDDEQAGFVGVGDPQLAARQDPTVAARGRARGQGERVAA